MATVSKFFIGARQVYLELSPQLASTLDETLDNLTVREIANDIANPYAPFQKFYLKDENNNIIQTFIISADHVELATLNPPRYIHNISLVQSSEYLTKHEIRNTVFSNSYDSANFSLRLGGRFFYNVQEQIMQGNNYTITIDLSKNKPYKMDFIPNFYACYQKRYLYSWYYNPFPNIMHDYEYFLYQDYSVKEWRDIYKNNPNNIIYPTITFTIGVDSMTWQLGNFGKGEVLEVPQNIIDWIKSHNSGTLSITSSYFGNLNGFTLSPNEDVNCPIYGKLDFNIEIMSIETSVYDAIDTLLKQQMKETKDYNSSNDSANIKPLFLLPSLSHNPDLYNLLTNTNAPNFIFTQSSMYDALVEIFKLFDAIFTIDDDGYLDIEYFNDMAQEEVLEPSKAGISKSLSEERFTNKLITYFQNTKISHKFPNSNDENATAYIGSKVLGVPSQSDFVFVVPKPIDIIKRAFLKTNFKVNKYTHPLNPPSITESAEEILWFVDVNFNEVVEITRLIIESSLWSILPMTGNNNPYSLSLYKENTLTYERGSRYIEIAKYYNIANEGTLLNKQIDILTNVYNYAMLSSLGVNVLTNYAFTSTIDFHEVKLALEYIALVDGKLVNESLDVKYDGETLINQSNGSIDINKLGLNMVGLSLKLGQPTMNMTQVFSKWDNRVKKGQYFEDDNGDRWVANNCVYTVIKPDLIQTNIEFIKNFNGLAKRIELNAEKRLSNISNELTVKCEETYGEYIYYSSNHLNSNLVEKIAFNGYYAANQIAMTFNNQLDTFSMGDYGVDIVAKEQTINISDIGVIDTSLKYLYRVTGYIQEINGNAFKINASQDMSGASAIIGLASDIDGCIQYDIMTDTFIYESLGFSEIYTVGDEISFFLLINEDKEVIFGGVCELNNVQVGVIDEDIQKVIPPNTLTVEYVLITAKDKNGIINNGDSGNVENVSIPLLVYGSGNSIAFEMSFDSPISAGNQLLDNSSLWSGGWFNNAVLYTDKEGRADTFTIDFVKMQDELTRYFPEMKSAPNTLLSTYSFGKIEDFAYYKKPNEIFALNYQLHFLPLNKQRDFLSNEFIKNNGFANGLNNRSFFVVVSTQPNVYSILDTKGEGTTYELDNVSSSILNVHDGMRLTMIFSATVLNWSNVKSWAIVDKDNNIYFASNNAPSHNTYLEDGEFMITFVTRHHRYID